MLTQPQYDEQRTASRAPFGNGTALGPFEWDPAAGSSEYGRVATQYDAGGFVADMPRAANYTAWVDALEASGWVDRQTRAWFVVLNVYNPNVRLLSTVSAIFEFMPAGGVIPWTQVRTFPLDLRGQPRDALRDVSLAGFMALLVYFTVREAWDAHRDWREYVGDRWNLVDQLNLFLFWVATYQAVRYVMLVRALDVDFTTAEFLPELGILSRAWISLWNTISLNVPLLFLKAFKFMQTNPRMLVLWRTLGRASSDLVAFAFFFAVVYFGFAMMGHLLYGQEIQSYRYINTSLTTLMRMLLGDFDYDSMRKANRVLAPVFFISFVIIGFFTLANMFLAIINDSYATVVSEMPATQPVTELIRSSAKALLRFMRLEEFLASRKKRIAAQRRLHLVRKLRERGRLGSIRQSMRPSSSTSSTTSSNTPLPPGAEVEMMSPPQAQGKSVKDEPARPRLSSQRSLGGLSQRSLQATASFRKVVSKGVRKMDKATEMARTLEDIGNRSQSFVLPRSMSGRSRSTSEVHGQDAEDYVAISPTAGGAPVPVERRVGDLASESSERPKSPRTVPGPRGRTSRRKSIIAIPDLQTLDIGSGLGSKMTLVDSPATTPRVGELTPRTDSPRVISRQSHSAAAGGGLGEQNVMDRLQSARARTDDALREVEEALGDSPRLRKPRIARSSTSSLSRGSGGRPPASGASVTDTPPVASPSL